jgi:hypothetical protein
MTRARAERGIRASAIWLALATAAFAAEENE